MTIYSAIGFLLAIIILAATPGPGMLATISKALTSDFSNTFSLICGLVSGDLFFLLFAVFGLSLVAQAMGDLFFIVKITGSIYLIFLGITLWRKGPDNKNSKYIQKRKTRWGNFLGGFIITLSNPKVILFYCSFLPTFLDLSALSFIDLFIVVAIVTFGITSVLSVYAFLAGRMRETLTREKTIKINQAAGGVMITAGIALAAQ